MAKLPIDEHKIIEKFGPHLNAVPQDGYSGRDEPDKVVNTHCCF